MAIDPAGCAELYCFLIEEGHHVVREILLRSRYRNDELAATRRKERFVDGGFAEHYFQAFHVENMITGSLVHDAVYVITTDGASDQTGEQLVSDSMRAKTYCCVC